jgi:hypothetical protein
MQEEREKIRELHQRQQDSLLSLQALESRFCKVALDDEETLQGSSISSRVPTMELMLGTQIATLPSLEKDQRPTTNAVSLNIPADDTSDTSESDATATDDEGEHLSIEELAKCAKHVERLLKRITRLQQSFENGQQTQQHRKRRVHKMYQRFRNKFESDSQVVSPPHPPPPPLHQYIPPPPPQPSSTLSDHIALPPPPPRPTGNGNLGGIQIKPPLHSNWGPLPQQYHQQGGYDPNQYQNYPHNLPPPPGPPPHLQLKLLEQHNEKRLLMARQEQAHTTSSNVLRAVVGPWYEGPRSVIKRSRSRSDIGQSPGLAELITQPSSLADTEVTKPSAQPSPATPAITDQNAFPEPTAGRNIIESALGGLVASHLANDSRSRSRSRGRDISRSRSVTQSRSRSRARSVSVRTRSHSGDFARERLDPDHERKNDETHEIPGGPGERGRRGRRRSKTPEHNASTIELERYSRSTEYFRPEDPQQQTQPTYIRSKTSQPMQMQMQPIIIREEAPQPIIIRERAPEPAFEFIERAEASEQHHQAQILSPPPPPPNPMLRRPMVPPHQAVQQMMPSQPSPFETPTQPRNQKSRLANHGYHALEDYHLQLALLEQQNKNRLLIARQEQACTASSNASGAPAPPDQNTSSEEFRLQVDASAPLSLSFNGDMEGRSLRMTTASNKLGDAVYEKLDPDHERGDDETHKYPEVPGKILRQWKVPTTTGPIVRVESFNWEESPSRSDKEDATCKLENHTSLEYSQYAPHVCDVLGCGKVFFRKEQHLRHQEQHRNDEEHNAEDSMFSERYTVAHQYPASHQYIRQLSTSPPPSSVACYSSTYSAPDVVAYSSKSVKTSQELPSSCPPTLGSANHVATTLPSEVSYYQPQPVSPMPEVSPLSWDPHFYAPETSHITMAASSSRGAPKGRRGPLTAELRHKAHKMRMIGACSNCEGLKIKVDCISIEHRPSAKCIQCDHNTPCSNCVARHLWNEVLPDKTCRGTKISGFDEYRMTNSEATMRPDSSTPSPSLPPSGSPRNESYLGTFEFERSSHDGKIAEHAQSPPIGVENTVPPLGGRTPASISDDASISQRGFRQRLNSSARLRPRLNRNAGVRQSPIIKPGRRKTTVSSFMRPQQVTEQKVQTPGPGLGVPEHLHHFTPDDSRKILTGVPPSGSSKTKAQREKDAADFQRLLSYTAQRPSSYSSSSRSASPVLRKNHASMPEPFPSSSQPVSKAEDMSPPEISVDFGPGASSENKRRRSSSSSSVDDLEEPLGDRHLWTSEDEEEQEDEGVQKNKRRRLVRDEEEQTESEDLTIVGDRDIVDVLLEQWTVPVY